MQILKILKYVEENVNSAFFYTPNIKENGKSYFFKNPSIILSGTTKNEVEQVLLQVDEFSHNKNLIGFATIPYEIGYYFQPKNIKQTYLGLTEVRFAFYEKKDVEIIDSNNLKFDNVKDYLSLEKEYGRLKLDISKKEYIEKINKIKKYIAEGDTYQINFTTKARFNFDGDLTSLFLHGIFNQSANYSVIINNENEFILSFSPELFFETDYKNIISKPMKGTLKRCGNTNEDKAIAEILQKDEKNRAENVMIVDLIRNDIGKIAKNDTVKVRKLFEIEKYETLYQLTSTVTGKLNKNKLSTIIKNLFPNGSITGAPKIRSMQIIAELENSIRNLYTGAIGIITSNNAVFNIPIRTINLNKITNKGVLGLGSGIVWDSNAESEYQEVKLKGQFISEPQEYFELIETILFENGTYFLLNYHLERLRKSADYFLFKYDEFELRTKLSQLKEHFNQNEKYKIRILLNKWGTFEVNYKLILVSDKPIKVLLSYAERKVNEKFLYHKTTIRPWDEELSNAKQKGFDEIVYCNKKGELLEGAISNIVINKNGNYFTPPIELGILSGCYRKHLLDIGKCKEKKLKIEDLKHADQIILCNSLRKEQIISKYNFIA